MPFKTCRLLWATSTGRGDTKFYGGDLCRRNSTLIKRRMAGMSSSISNATECHLSMTPVRQLYLHLMSFPTATSALKAWISSRGLGSDPVRVNVVGQVKHHTRIGRNGTIAQRSVRLVSGPHVLSEATIVYREYVLSNELRDKLRSTDLPFGHIIASFGPSRRTTFSRAIGAPVMSRLVDPENTFTPVLDVHATISTPKHGPIARVHETYGASLLLTIPSPLGHGHDPQWRTPRDSVLART